MATSGGRRRPQKYPEELRERAVRMVLDIRDQTGDKHGVITRVARELGIGTESLRGWVNQAEIDAGARPGTSTADAQRIAELERENRELRRANDILKAASVFFATELDGRPKKWSPSSTPTGRGSPVGCDGGSSRSARFWRSPPPPTTRPRPGRCRPGRSPTRCSCRCCWRCGSATTRSTGAAS